MLLARLAEPRSLDIAWHDGVDGHAVRRDLDRERAHEAEHGGLRGAVVREAGLPGDRARDRAGQDDAAVPACEHAREARLRGVDRALDVDVHHVIPERVVDGRELGVRVDAGVRRQDVDAPVRRRHVRGERLDRGAIGHVGADALCREPAVAERRRGRGRSSLVEVGEHDPRARLGERGSDPKADSAGAAGDDGDLLRE